jgi:hypothetical protein
VLFDFIYPNVRDVIGTQSNFETSGGFGPNQVATFLGLGMFVFFHGLYWNRGLNSCDTQFDYCLKHQL